MRTLRYISIFIFLFLLSFQYSCEKVPATYQVVNNLPSFTVEGMPYYNGSMYETIVYYYVDDGVVDHQGIGILSADGGKSDIIEIPDEVTKMKVAFKYLPITSQYYDHPSNHLYYVAAYKYITKGEHHEIIIDEYTMVSNKINFDSQ